jgi:hypothetical protein
MTALAHPEPIRVLGDEAEGRGVIWPRFSMGNAAGAAGAPPMAVAH